LCVLIVSVRPLVGGIRPGPDVGCELVDNRDNAGGVCRESGLHVARVEAVDELADRSADIVLAGSDGSGRSTENDGEQYDYYLFH
jgi:hypothetical protein